MPGPDQDHQPGKKLAVVVLNMGGPDSPRAVRRFLFNLFRDAAIIPLPGLLRLPLAAFIAARRGPKARAIYARIGGASPILAETRKQTAALEAVLNADDDARVFIAMRYWHPFSAESVREVAEFDPDEVILLPLYPQFSTTTSASSLNDWRAAARRAGLEKPIRQVCCYPVLPGLIATQARRAAAGLDRLKAEGMPARLLFSAHGLPRRTIAGGDPYQWQVEQTAGAVVSALARPGLDWAVCYQSRVGRLEWIGPSIGDEIARAGTDGRALVVVPIAFVSEHSETLVELDIQYREAAAAAGVPAYVRVAALGDDREFIAGLAELVHNSAHGCPPGGRLCPLEFTGCAATGPGRITG